MTRNKSLQFNLFDTCNIVFLCLISFAMLYPIVYIFSVSISDFKSIALGKVWLFPIGFNDLLAYKSTFSDPGLWRAYYNTIIYAVTGTILHLAIVSMAAYPMSVKGLYGKKIIMIFFAITLFFSGGIIPNYILVLKLGMYDSIWALILPGAMSLWSMVIMRTNFSQIPDSMIESVHIDGGKSWIVLTRIVLPLSKPILATIALFTIVSHWNSFFPPFVYLSSSSKIPLQVYLRTLLMNPRIMTDVVGSAMDSMIDESMAVNTETRGLLTAIKMSSILVSLGPILLAYPFMQKYFVKGVLVGAIKG